MAQILWRCPSAWFFGLGGIMPLSPHAPLVSWTFLLWSSTSFSGFSLYLKNHKGRLWSTFRPSRANDEAKS